MLPWLPDTRRLKIAVIGDIILDEYLEGRVERISPEAPVPINVVKQSTFAAGGAANSALNISLVGGQAELFGTWGRDASAENLRMILERHEISSRHIIASPERPTVRKTRVTSGHQQMLRIDWEQTQPISRDEQERLSAALRGEEVQGILVSDYGKGVLQGELLTAIFQCAQEKGIPCIVDPKGQDFTKYRGCSLITPNYGESCAALGLKSDPGHRGEDLGRALQERYGLNDVLVTMGPSGMVYVPKDPAEAAIFRSPRAREVYDVSGAGDTVAALMALSLAAKIPAQDAVDFANLAAGIVVEKRGTQPVLRRELEERLETTNAALYARYFGKAPVRLHTSAKIHTAASLAALMEEEHKKGRSFVFTNGCFDILHAGHVTLLEQAKAFGSALIVAVNTDESVRALNKGSERPLVSLADRMKVLAALSCVDYVLPFGEETPLQLIEHLKPDVLVKGGDYRLDTIVGASSVIARGGSVEIIPLLPARSTTSLVNAIREHGRGAAHGLG